MRRQTAIQRKNVRGVGRTVSAGRSSARTRAADDLRAACCGLYSHSDGHRIVAVLRLAEPTAMAFPNGTGG
jgi:hypothetical protein